MLGEERERQIAAYELEPVAEQGDNVEALKERIVDDRGDKAHRGAHDRDRYRDNRSFEDDRMGRFYIEHLGRDLERHRTSDQYLKRIGEGEFDQHDCPDRQHRSEHHDTALFIDGSQHAARIIETAQHIAVEYINVVKHKGVDGDDNGDEREHHSLKLISRHNFLLK